MSHLSIATTAIPGDLSEKLEKIAASGFHGVELYEPDFISFDGAAEDICKLLEVYNLQITLLQPFTDFEGLIGDQRNQALKRLESKFDLMQSLGTRVYLKVELQELMRRLEKDKKRPLLQKSKPEEHILEMLQQRKSIYEEAECIIDTTDLSPHQMVTEIIRKI